MRLYMIKTPADKNNTYFIKWISGLALLITVSACDNSVDIPRQPIRTVRVETVSANGTLIQRRFAGRIDAVSTVDLSFQVPGRMIELPAQEGLLIAKGQLIASLDRHDYQLSLEQSVAQYNLAKLDVTRKRNLLKSGSLPKAMLDQAETTFKLSQVALKTAKRNLAYTRITAPFDSLISQRLIDNYTNVGAYQPIVRVQDLTELRVRINIPEQMVKLLGQTADFNAVAIFKDRPDQRFPLSYREHVTEAGSVAQTFEVVFGLARENNQHVLPGMTVAVVISRKQGVEAAPFAIPVTALDYDEQGKPRVWIFDPQVKTVAPRSITLGTIKKSRIPVLSGLQQGEKIVTAGAHLLRDGMTVRRFVSF